MFPYKDDEEYKNHDFYKSIEEVNIGGIPFFPSTIGLMEEFLDKLINESLYSIFERSLGPISRESYLMYLLGRCHSTAGDNLRREQFLLGH